MIRNIANIYGKEWKDNDVKKSSNQLISFSMEFLSVKYLTLNLNNLGILEEVKEGLKKSE
jgi:glucan phosphorylase